jgi:hypothetical protein
VFNFHQESQPLLLYIGQIFRAGKFFRFGDNVLDIADRVIMNLQPSVAAHAAIVDRPRYLRYLYRVVVLIEEKAPIDREN